MKKPVLAALGIAGACAACCAIPLAIPLISGLSIAGVISLEGLAFSGQWIAAAAGLVASLMVGAGMWFYKRRNAAGASCGSCGCSPAAGAGKS